MPAEIKPGRYRIALVAGPMPHVGDNVEYPVKEQIVTNAKYDVWAVINGLNGGYQLILSKPAALFTKEDNGNVVGDVNPQADTVWSIVEKGQDYVIQRFHSGSANEGWVVANPRDPTCPVTLGAIDNPPKENQLWRFYPIY